MMSVSCFQRHQRKETSISVLEKDEKAAWLDVFFDEVQKLRAEWKFAGALFRYMQVIFIQI